MLQLQIYRSLNKFSDIVPLPICGNSIYANSVEADAYMPVFCSRCNTEWLLPIHIDFKGDPKKEYKCPRCYSTERSSYV